MLASPLQRVAAAVSDLLVLMLIHVPLVLWNLKTDRDQILGLGLGAVAFLLPWLYLWLGWWCGATLGQRFWGLRIERVDGRPMGGLTALVRLVGYFLAAIPLKFGFLPIFWHPRRQGWHDRLAGTIVVDRAKPREPLPPVPDRRRAPVVPDLRLPWSGFAPALLGYALLMSAITWPLLPRLTTHRLGYIGDASHFAWGYWYFRHALEIGHNPFTCELLFHPHTVSLRLHTMNWVNCVLAAGMQQFFSLTVTYNLLLLGSLLANCLAMYWLVAAVVKDKAVGWVGGLLGLAPYFLARTMGHMNLVSGELLILFVLVAYAALVSGRANQAVGAAVLLALTGYGDWYYLVFGVTALTTLLLALRLGCRPEGQAGVGRQMLIFGGIGLGAGLLLSPLVVPVLLGDGGKGTVALGDVAGFSAPLWQFLRPSPWHPVFGGAGRAATIEHIVTPGYLWLLLAAVGLWRRARRLWPWAMLGLVGVVFACGVDLVPPATPGLPYLPVYLLAGPPGNALSPPWQQPETMDLLVHLIGTPELAMSDRTNVELPLRWLREIVPLLKPLKAPARFVVLVLIALGVLGGSGLRWLRLRWRSTRRRRLSRGALPFAAVMILFEFWPRPLPLTSMAVPDFYHRLAREPGVQALIEVPSSAELHEYQYYQTVHHQPLFEAHLSRLPPEEKRISMRNELLRLLGPTSLTLPGRERPGLQLESASPADRDPARLAPHLAELIRYDARYVVLHGEGMTAAGMAAARELFEQGFGLRPQVEPPLVIYRLPASPGELEAMMNRRGERGGGAEELALQRGRLPGLAMPVVPDLDRQP